MGDRVYDGHRLGEDYIAHFLGILALDGFKNRFLCLSVTSINYLRVIYKFGCVPQLMVKNGLALSPNAVAVGAVLFAQGPSGSWQPGGK